MIRHVVMLRFNESVTEDDVAALGRALDGLPGQIPELATYQHGADLDLAPSNFDYAITATVHDIDGFVAYRDHDAHRQVIATHVAPNTAERVAVQFSIDG